MSEPRTTRDPGDASNDPETPARHDRAGRVPGTPYVPPGRDEQGRTVPAVPHEGFLVRLARSLVIGQSVVLACVALVGFAASGGNGYIAASPVTVFGLGMNGLHATVLAVAAVLGAAAGASRRRLLRGWAVLQLVAFLLLFVFGAAYSAATVDRTGMNLNGLDHLLHGALAILGFAVMMLSSARIVEPPPAPAPYPHDEGSG